jgi:hypothetical protein
MSKSESWKRARDKRQAIAADESMAELREIDPLLPSGWYRGWYDRIDAKTGQIAIVYIKRDCDEVAIAQWSAYAGHGERKTLIPATAIAELKALIANPPPPAARPKEIES